MDERWPPNVAVQTGHSALKHIDRPEVATASGPRTEAQPIPSDFPPIVYLPCADAVDDPAKAAVEMRQTRDGRIALLAYSALDRLHDKCGVDQPWILMPTAGLASLQAAQPFQLLLLDVEIPPDKRRTRR